MIAQRYSLIREIGRGGTGTVWLGRDEVLGRDVALKRIGLLPGADETDLPRAEREARLSARINHPHVVAVYDVVEESETRWLVMEYVEGVSLGARVRERTLTPDQARPILRQAADALLAAHRAGIVHRDVKPSNILLTTTGEAKLTDFGIARITTDPSLTQTGLLTGSPAYLAPEVISGEAATSAADVWSLGATAYHLLSGRTPYDVGENVVAALYRIVHEQPPRLPGAGPLAPLIENTLVGDPAGRWSMEQVRDFLDGRQVAPIAARTPVSVPAGSPPAEQPTLTVTREPHSWRAIVLAAAAVLVLAVLAFAFWPDRQEPTSSAPNTVPSTTSTPTPTPTSAPRPSAAGMETFIRDYVAAVAEDPDTAWTMLTPKFQRESGGLDRYRRFWDAATNGRVIEIEANPEELAVSYQVRFDNWDNGPGPTVLDLEYAEGRYRIDGERTEGFVPQG